jgi:hypothetical protein
VIAALECVARRRPSFLINLLLLLWNNRWSLCGRALYVHHVLPLILPADHWHHLPMHRLCVIARL